jgi:type I restriction enzyme R subunit
VLRLQLALLRSEPGFTRLRDEVKKLAGLLEDKSAIPMVRERMTLIQDVRTDEWWQHVSVPMLEVMRRRLRGLIQLIDRGQRRIVYTDFEDLMGNEVEVELAGFATGTDQPRFLAKARAFLRSHLDHVAISKLRMNKPLTASDLDELERILVESGVGEEEDIRRAAEHSHGLGLFVRSLIGMDRQAATEAMSRFIVDESLSANQIQFVNLIVDHLTEHGVVQPEKLYHSPFTDITPQGPDGLFTSTQVDALFQPLKAVRATATAA